MHQWCRLLLITGILTLSVGMLHAQEICDNAIDDDLDGLIDLNDPDCDCPILEPVSLIPNPSFEDRSCCPSSRSQMDCAKTWIQASVPTTDYIHTCGWMGWEGLPVPLPIPDGDACVGFRNGRFGQNSTNSNWKEYTGACLIAPLRANVSYKFQFYIGFTHLVNSPATNVVFYGTTNCDNLPFGGNDERHGCPTNGPGWKRLGQVRASGANNWVLKEINLTPTEDIVAIAIGPDCQQLTASQSIYYFFDNLILAEQSAFEFEIRPTDQLCSDELRLELPFRDSLSYQWYKDGIALPGEVFSGLSQMYGDGKYEVMLTGPDQSCKVTDAYHFKRPSFLKISDVSICEGEFYTFHNHSLDHSGTFTDTLKTMSNCDSIVQLNLNVVHNTEDTIFAKILPHESYQVGNRFFSNPGIFTIPLSNRHGCDSTVHLQLDFYQYYIPNAFTPNDDGINDIFSIMGGQDVVQIQSLRIFNRWGKLMYEGEGLAPNNTQEGWDGTIRGRLAAEGVYVFTAKLMYDDGKARQTTGSFTLIR